MSEYLKDTKQKNDEFHAIMRRIAESYGYDYDRTHDHGGHMIAPNGARFFCRRDNYKPLVEVSYSVDTPNGYGYVSLRDLGVIKYDDKDPSRANYTYTKSINALAADITRRSILPGLQLHGAVTVKFAERAKREAEKLEISNLVTSIVNTVAHNADRPCEPQSFHIYDKGNISNAHFRVETGGHLYIERISFNDPLRAITMLIADKLASKEV